MAGSQAIGLLVIFFFQKLGTGRFVTIRRFLLRNLQLLLLSLLMASTLVAQAPDVMTYQGKLQNEGSPVNGLHSLTFHIYDAATNGTLLWSETHSEVQVTDGLFSVDLGTVSSLSGLAFNADYFLTFQVDGGTEMTPRLQLGPTPFAIGGVTGMEGQQGPAQINGKVACGFDVHSAEIFNDNCTLEIKENNCIITFDDTSTKPFHPNHDWAIGANDHISNWEHGIFIWDMGTGTAQDFRTGKHVFIVNGPTDAMRLKASGAIGFGTANPSDVDFVSQTPSVAMSVTSTAAAPSTGIAGGESDHLRLGTVTAHSFTARAGTTAMELSSTGTLTMQDGGSYNGTWNPASSRAIKDEIKELSAEDAKAALLQLAAKRYSYKKEPHDERVGFIAEDVPELVASLRRSNVSEMDVAALLTRVVQGQRSLLKEQKEKLQEINLRLQNMENKR